MAQQPPANSLVSLDTLKEAYFRLDGELRYAFINFAAENILGVPSADLIGKTPWEIGPVSAGASLERKLRRARDERTVVSFNACLEPSHRWHRIAAMPDSAGGLVVQISGLLSGQRNTDAYFNSMREAVAVHRLTFSGTNPVNYILLDANPIFEEMVGLERRDLVNRFASDVFHTRDAPFLYEFASAVQSRAATRFEAWFPPIGRHFSISVLPLGDDLFASLFFDITEQIKTAERLRKAEEKFARAFRSNPAAIAIADLTTEIYLEVNDAFEQISGYRRDEIVGKTWDEIRLWPDRSNRDEALALLRREKRLRNWEFRFAKKDGGTGSGLLSAELIELDGHAVGITATMDITELLRLQGQLRQSQKLESIGRLAGGVAHDFNNLLTVINGYADLVAGRLDPQDSLRSNVDEIRKAGQRAAGLTRQLLTLSRTQIIQPKPLDLNGIITESEQMLRGLIGEDIRLFTKLDPLLGNVMADPEQLYSVVMNLVVNARDAMPDGGNLFIKTANVEMNEEDPAIPPDAKPGAYVLMTVTDTGSGIDEDTRQHIFEPFFTTKERGKGTGLGLSTVYGVVRQNGGWIEVSGELGVGTSFKIYLPRVDALSVEVRPESPPAAGLQGDETVLIVEDQEAVLRYAKASLETYGYRVLDAANGNAAMAVAQNYSGQIDLILTDVVLPGMNGKVLTEQLAAARPNLKVLFMSGYPADVIAHRGVLDSGVSYIPKPFSPDGLASKIREVLAGTSSSAS